MMTDDMEVMRTRTISFRQFGPKDADHFSIGKPCPACGVGFAAGDYTTLIPLGPGPKPSSRAQARSGSGYCAVAVEVHWSCATGEES